ncbi:MAG: hemerythrin [Candidatus Atribacteria bacterium]|nr:hemerythrin [Candidatus Atribacteria bacterium]
MKWNDSLAIGIPKIDHQHQQLIKQVDQLMEACRQGKGKEAVRNIIQFLEDYVITHFQDEEQYMTEHAYPQLPTHRLQHQNFTQSFSALKNRFEEQGPSLQFVVQVNQMVMEWLINHISQTDREFGNYLKQKNLL